MSTTEETLTLAREIAGAWDWATEVVQPEENRLDVYLKNPDDLVAIVTGLRVKRLGYLAAITGLDLGTEAGELEVLYHFCAGAAVITLRVRLNRQETAVASLSELIPSAEPYERELREMYGVTINGLVAPDYLYLPDDWPTGVYPMRRDFDPQSLLAGNGARTVTE
jgi:Ni,Fe-hydrogenase III component G